MFDRIPSIFSASTSDDPNKDYESIINNNTIEQLKELHKNTPICTNCNAIPIFQNILRNTNDVDKLKFLMDDLKIKGNLYQKVDAAIEEGNLPLTRFLIMRDVEYSKYAKQMAIVNKNYKTALFADTYGKERCNTSIKTVHSHFMKKSGIQWDPRIPPEYRF